MTGWLADRLAALGLCGVDNELRAWDRSSALLGEGNRRCVLF